MKGGGFGGGGDSDYVDGKGVVNFWSDVRVFKDRNYKFYFMTLV